MEVEPAETGRYALRVYEESDRSAVVDLYERTTGRDGDAWLRWKHETNPYVDHVPIVVATCGGEVVAARSGFVLPLRAGGDRYLSVQPAEALVDPDHRGAGLLDRTTARLRARYRRREPDLLVEFRTGADNWSDQWRVAGTVPTFRRVQRPSRLAVPDGTAVTRAALGAAEPVARCYLRARDAMTEQEDVTVERERGIATGPLLSAYRTERPTGWHALRDGSYYDWRYDNPNWRYRTYLARADHGVVAALVVGESQESDRVALVEVLPLAGNRRRVHQFGALVDRVVADYRDAAAISVCGDRLPRDLLASRGFFAAGEWPLSTLSGPPTAAVRPLTDDEPWRTDGVDPGDIDDWALTFAERGCR